MESEPPYLYVRGNPINLTDPSGNTPNCQDSCTTPPTPGSYADIARISCWDIENSAGKTTKSYLTEETSKNPAALLARVAMGENNRVNGANDRVFVMWIVKLRVEMGFSSLQTSLENEIFTPSQFTSVTGEPGIKGMVEVEKPYEVIRDSAGKCIKNSFKSNVLDAIYPCDTGKDANSYDNTLRRWVFAYHMAQRIIGTTSERFPYEFPKELRGLDSFKAKNDTEGTRTQFFVDGNYYHSADDRDLE